MRGESRLKRPGREIGGSLENRASTRNDRRMGIGRALSTRPTRERPMGERHVL
ncbi:hypothetical protein [Halomontanus rarus]|uniref:hypothetical protein n=1 Tax=Halomontanus rarus TaxID=3034020 RepID=UPI001A98FE93